MAPRSDNLVHESATTTGTGNFTISSVTARKTFNEAFGTGGSDLFWYCIVNRDANEWEVGTGHLLDATTLVRDTVIDSSNADALVSFTAGTKDVTSDVEWSSVVYQGVNGISLGTDGAHPITNKVGLLGKSTALWDGLYLASEGTGIEFGAAGDVTLKRQSGTARVLTGPSIAPETHDTYDLGTSALRWNDIFLASEGGSGVNLGVDTILSRATEGVIATTASLAPSTNDGESLGYNNANHGRRWADLFLATRGSLAAGINWGASSLVAATSGAISVTGSYRHVAVSDGTSTNGAFTVSDAGGNMRTFINGGSTAGMVPQTNDSVVVLFMENSATPGIVTATGDYDFVGGDAFTTATGDDFILTSIVLNGRSSLVVQDATNNIV